MRAKLEEKLPEILAGLAAAAAAMKRLAEERAEQSRRWLAHAEQAVADLNPTARRLQLLHEGVKPDWYGLFGAKLVEGKRPPGVYA